MKYYTLHILSKLIWWWHPENTLEFIVGKVATILLINSLNPDDTILHHILVNISSGNGLVLDGTKPLPDSVLAVNIHKS